MAQQETYLARHAKRADPLHVRHRAALDAQQTRELLTRTAVQLARLEQLARLDRLMTPLDVS